MRLGGRPDSRLVLAVVFTIESAALVVLGAAHLLRHGIETAAVYGLVPLVVGLLILVAALDVWRERQRSGGSAGQPVPREPWQMVTVVAGQASLIPLLLTPLWTEWGSGVHDAVDWTICLVTLVPLFIALAILGKAVYSHPEGTLNKGWVVVAALFPLASTAQFWYTTFYEPSRQRPNINIEATLDGDVGGDGATRVTATIMLENTGKTELTFFDVIYTVTAFDVDPGAQADQAEVEAALAQPRVTSNDLRDEYLGLLQVGRVIRPGGHLAEGQQLKTSVVFDVEAGTADKLRLTVLASALVGEGDLDSKDCPREADVSMCREAGLPIQGWPRTELADSPSARTRFLTPDDRLPSLQTEFFYPSGSGDVVTQVREIYPYWNSRGFTSSVEYGLPSR